MASNTDQFPGGSDGWRRNVGRRLAGIGAALVVVTGLDLLVSGRPNPLSYLLVLVVYVAVDRLLAGQIQPAEPGANQQPRAFVRLSPGRARLVTGLGVAILALGALGALATEGLERAASISLFVAIGLTNLAWGLGSLLPEGPTARAARLAMLPLGVAMFIAMFAWVALQASARW